MNQPKSQTLILGGGFTGLFTALYLRHHKYIQPLNLIDPQERFTFKPLLYEFLSGEMNDEQVWPRYEQLLNGSDITFIQDTVQAIDLQQRQVELVSGLRYTYEYLVLALGSTVSYFGVDGAQENSFLFNTGEDAVVLTRHLRNCLQQASQMEDEEQRRTLLSVAIVGAGPAGVELAATLADLLPNWYTELGGNPQEIRVVLLNRGSQILKGDINHCIRDTAQSALKKRTVAIELITGAKVSAVHPHQVEFIRQDQTKFLQAATTVWTAGKATHPVIKNLPIPEEQRDKRGRIKINPTLQLADFPEVFAGGDCAVVDAQDPLPPTAQVAYQQGAAIANNLKAISEGKAPSAANVRLRGSLLKLGLGESAANLFDRFEVKGKIGHIVREGTYLELLPTPVHNFKATTEWLIDEIFHHHSSPASLVGTVAGQGSSKR